MSMAHHLMKEESFRLMLVPTDLQDFRLDLPAENLWTFKTVSVSLL